MNVNTLSFLYLFQTECLLFLSVPVPAFKYFDNNGDVVDFNTNERNIPVNKSPPTTRRLKPVDIEYPKYSKIILIPTKNNINATAGFINGKSDTAFAIIVYNALRPRIAKIFDE